MDDKSIFDDLEDDFDPLFASDEEINQTDMDDDNPYDTVDYPTLRNMPEEFDHHAVYTPERLGGTRQAALELIDHNPARRGVLLGILEACEKGCKTSELDAVVEKLQANNKSVYATTTLCRMLQRAGALTLFMPETAKEVDNPEEGVEYLEITETIDPVWTSTEEALGVCAEFRAGATFKDIVLDRDSQYIDVYKAIMNAVHDQPKSVAQIEEITDTFELVMHPRRFGGHFVDMLEKCDALEWNGDAWQLTKLGENMLFEMNKGNE